MFKVNIVFFFIVFINRIKGAEKINPGERIPTSCEQDVFKYLNIPYRTPEERDF